MEIQPRHANGPAIAEAVRKTRSVVVVSIKVQYDAYNRQFKLLDRDLAYALEDGETYVLLADVSPEDLKPKDHLQIPADVEHAAA